jgi:hypothetical protein
VPNPNITIRNFFHRCTARAAAAAAAALADAQAAAGTDAREMSRLKNDHDNAVKHYFDEEVARLLVRPEASERIQGLSRELCASKLAEHHLLASLSGTRQRYDGVARHLAHLKVSFCQHRRVRIQGRSRVRIQVHCISGPVLLILRFLLESFLKIEIKKLLWNLNR